VRPQAQQAPASTPIQGKPVTREEFDFLSGTVRELKKKIAELSSDEEMAYPEPSNIIDPDDLPF